MFKQIKYNVLYAELVEGVSVWKEEACRGIFFSGAGGVDSVLLERTAEDGSDITMVIDNISSFAREFTTMFDKIGAGLYSGDIVKVPIAMSKLEMTPDKTEYTPEEIKAGAVVEEMLLPVNWINGGYCIAVEGFEAPIYLDQRNVRQMEKVGNVYQHSKLLEKPVDEEKVFKGKEKHECEECKDLPEGEVVAGHDHRISEENNA